MTPKLPPPSWGRVGERVLRVRQEKTLSLTLSHDGRENQKLRPLAIRCAHRASQSAAGIRKALFQFRC